MKRTIKKLAVTALFALMFVQAGAAADQVHVFVSIAPQKYFVQQIGKDLVDVQVMVQPGANPASYEPKPSQMVALSRARAYFAIDVLFEDIWLKKFTGLNPKMQVVHTDMGIEKLPISGHHDEESGHEHGILDPHIWLSPPLVKLQAQTILRALREIDPAHGADFEANYKRFMAEIDELNLQLKAAFEKKQGMRFMVFHPAWGYFARAYGLEQVPIEFEGKAPKPALLKELITFAKKKGITVIFVQPQFSAKSATLIAKAIDGRVIVANPLAEDWMSNMRKVAKEFRAALK